MDLSRIPQAVVERLGWYVYAYVNPTDGQISYIGKGRGQRALAHLIRLKGHRVDVIAHGLPDEATAFHVERALIDAIGPDRLTNKVRGQGIELGREPIIDLLVRYAAQPVDVADPLILIRINRLYVPGMSADELYDATRGVWKVGERRESAKYALAVYRGIVREVYEIRSWHPAGATPYQSRVADERWPGRWEFQGVVAPEQVRQRYLTGSVAHLLPDGAQNPIAYAP